MVGTRLRQTLDVRAAMGRDGDVPRVAVVGQRVQQRKVGVDPTNRAHDPSVLGER